MSKKRNRNILLTITFVLTIIQILMFVFSGFVVAYNLFGFVDYYNQIMSSILGTYDLNMYLTSYYIELVLFAIVFIYSAIFFF